MLRGLFSYGHLKLKQETRSPALWAYFGVHSNVATNCLLCCTKKKNQRGRDIRKEHTAVVRPESVIQYGAKTNANLL